MVFIQRLSEVNDASMSLERSGYYKNCTAKFLEYVNDRRERQHDARKQKEDVQEEDFEEGWQDACCPEGTVQEEGG